MRTYRPRTFRWSVTRLSTIGPPQYSHVSPSQKLILFPSSLGFVFVDGNDTHLAGCGKATHNPYTPSVQRRTNDFVLTLFWPSSPDLPVTEPLLHVIDVETVYRRLIICVFGQIVQTVTDKGLNLRDSAQELSSPRLHRWALEPPHYVANHSTRVRNVSRDWANPRGESIVWRGHRIVRSRGHLELSPRPHPMRESPSTSRAFSRPVGSLFQEECAGQWAGAWRHRRVELSRVVLAKSS